MSRPQRKTAASRRQASAAKQSKEVKDPAAPLIKEAEELAAAEPEASDGEAAPPPEVSGTVDAKALRRAITQARTARQRAEQRQAALEKKQADLDDRITALKQEKEELARRANAVGEAEKNLAARKEQLLALEEEAKREFAGYREQHLEALRQELGNRREEFETALRKAEKEHQARYAKRESQLVQRTTKLDEREAELNNKELDRQRRERHLQAREDHLDQEVDDRIRDRLATLETDLSLARQHADGAQQQLEAMRQLARQRGSQLAEHEAAVAELGRPAPEAAALLRRLSAENRQLREAADAHPVEDRERLAELAQRCHDLTVEQEELLRENAELRRHVTATAISTTERQNAQMINEALQRQNDTLTKELDQQSARLKQMQAIVKDAPPFPACSAMDDNPDYQRRPELGTERVMLRDLVSRIRNRLAAELGLYYSEADMRCFVAGLAASRLHLLEGISGIGKTRLPEAFAQIIGAGRATVAVAAEWRSPQDLLGYYNAFERRFYESEFTQGLYKAQLPLFRGKPFFVVLDEMNLSHPEQYFSDLLSAMERKEADPGEKPLLPLMTAPVFPAPDLLREDRALQLPDNVWFVGTANQDETTVRFADKTYDRAHVLELPSRPERFTPDEDARPLTPVSLSVLSKAFDAAEEKHGGAADQVLTFLDEKLGGRLRDDFGVSWGIRLERQAKRFVPVTVATGGPHSIGEAADHLLATKVLRKLAGRVEFQASDLEALRDDIESLWGQADAFRGSKPVKSKRVLNKQIRSLGTI